MFFHRKNKKGNGIGQTQASLAECEPSASAKKILLVDDDAVTLAAMSMKLKSKGYRVLMAQNGSEALAASRMDKPDLLLLDVNFPPTVGGVEWNGFLLAEWLQRRDGTGATPMILMSGREEPDYQKRAAAAGATAFIRKPLNADELLTSVDLALGGKSAGSDSTAVDFSA